MPTGMTNSLTGCYLQATQSPQAHVGLTGRVGLAHLIAQVATGLPLRRGRGEEELARCVELRSLQSKHRQVPPLWGGSAPVSFWQPH